MLVANGFLPAPNIMLIKVLQLWIM